MSILNHSPSIVRNGLVLCLDAGLNRSTNALADTGHPTKAGLTYGGPGVEEDYQPTGCKLISRADKTIAQGTDLRAYDSNTQSNWAGPATGAGALFTKVSGSSSNGFYGYLNTGYGFTSNPVVGRRYRLLMRAKSSSSIHLRFYDGVSDYIYFSADVGTTLKTYTFDFTCLHATNAFVYGTGSFSDGETVYFDRYEVYELTPWLDVSGHNNHAEITNAPTFSVESGAGGTRSFDFDGSSDYMNLGAGSSLNFGTGGVTIDAWVKTTQSSEGQIIRVSYTSPYVLFGVASGKLRASIHDGSNGANDENNNGPTVNDGDWHHVAAVFNRIGNIVFYKDAVATTGVSMSSVTDSIGAPNPYAAISRRPNSDSQYFDGKITCVRAYNRALTAAEIQQNYRTHKGRFGK